METIIRLSPSELTSDWLEKVKALFQNERQLEVRIKPVSNPLVVNEDKEAYETRINEAIENLEKNRDTVSFSLKDFEDTTSKLQADK